MLSLLSSNRSSAIEVSLLHKLRAPPTSDLSQKRKVHMNPPKGRQPCSSRGLCNPNSVTLAQHVREFPDESLKVSLGKLFCNPCREDLQLKRSALQAHIMSVKHADGKHRLECKRDRERETLERFLRGMMMGRGTRVRHRSSESLLCNGCYFSFACRGSVSKH